MVILDGKKVSNDIKDEIAEQVKKMKEKVNIKFMFNDGEVCLDDI